MLLIAATTLIKTLNNCLDSYKNGNKISSSLAKSVLFETS